MFCLAQQTRGLDIPAVCLAMIPHVSLVWLYKHSQFQHVKANANTHKALIPIWPHENYIHFG